MAVDDERRVARIAEIVDAAGDLRQRDALVVCAVDVEAQLVLREFEYAVDPVERRPDARRAVRELARRVRRRFEAATGERRDDVEHAGVRLVFEREFRAGHGRRSTRPWSPGRPAARGRDSRAGVRTSRSAGSAGCAPPTPGRNRRAGRACRGRGRGSSDTAISASGFETNRSGSDTSTRACFAGRGRDRPFGIAAQPVERQARLVESPGTVTAALTVSKCAEPPVSFASTRPHRFSTPGQPARGWRAVSWAAVPARRS